MEETPGLSDETVDALRRGDPHALRTLVERYQARIYGFASRMCRSREDAKDVLQDTLLAVVRSAKDFRGDSPVSAWLFRIAANACRKMRRRGKFEPDRELSLEELLPEHRARVVPDATAASALAQPPATPDELLARGTIRDAVENAIAELPAPYRAVLLLRDVEGLSTEATAEALGLGVPAVKTRLHRARLFLRQRLGTP